MRPILAISFIFLLLTSCLPSGEKKERKFLKGNWKHSVDLTKINAPTRTSYSSRRGTYFLFLNDSIVDTKTPYFLKEDTLKESAFDFIGTSTKYKIENDSLSLFNPTTLVWEPGQKLIKSTQDTLILAAPNGDPIIFTSYRDEVDSIQVADKIVLSTSGCNGKCPIVDVIISANGNVIFFGEKFVDRPGFYEGNITDKEYKTLEGNFKKADIKNLGNRYALGFIDEETITITFLKDDKIIQSIKDYGKAGPDELIAGYIPLRYLFQKLKLNELSKNELPFYLDLHYFKVERGEQKCDLTQAESFLLWDYLRKGIETKAGFTKKYDLVFTRNFSGIRSIEEMDDPALEKKEKNVVSMETDGRFYKIVTKDRGSVTIDIGFNFFEVNRDFLEFKHKTIYN